jgi:hypothetical protein
MKDKRHLSRSIKTLKYYIMGGIVRHEYKNVKSKKEGEWKG